MKFYIIAGEMSGDIHGGNLMAALQERDKEAKFRFWGGDSMAKIGGKPVQHVKDLAFMGFLEVIKNIGTIFSMLRFCKKDIDAFQPDVIILIDYPGFNLRIAEWAKKRGYKVVYYIVPQVWAWHKSRVKLLRKYTDTLLAILPFEESFYKNHGCTAHFVGHPLLDEIHKPLTNQPDIPDFDVALLPGSRKQEVQHMLPVFLQTAELLGLSCVVAATRNLPQSLYEELISDAKLSKARVKVVYNAMYPILQKSKFAFVTSGTATLETALWNVPQIVAYKGSYISYFIAKNLISLKYISLVNLIVDRNLVPELIQDTLTPTNLAETYKKMLAERQKTIDGYAELIRQLGDTGASGRAADFILSMNGKG